MALVEKLIYQEDGRRTYGVLLKEGEEVTAALLRFSRENYLGTSHFTALGDLKDVVLAYYDGKSIYKENRVSGVVQVLMFDGDIVFEHGTPQIDARLMVGKPDSTVAGGRFVRALASPALEIVITETPRHFRRQEDPQTRLPLIPL